MPVSECSDRCRVLQTAAGTESVTRQETKLKIIIYLGISAGQFSSVFFCRHKDPPSSFDSSSDYKPDKPLVTKDQEEEPIAGDICLETF